MSSSAPAESSRYNPDRKSDLLLYDFLSTGLVPESLIRAGIRKMLGQKLKELDTDDCELQLQRTVQFKQELEQYPIAIATDLANNQHYEVPTEFFMHVLGPRMKYSSCLWNEAKDLPAAEEEMLCLSAARAEIRDGHKILDLGCGWGSFTLFAAEKYPDSSITAVSNSRSQKQFIEKKAAERGLVNIEVITADIKDLNLDRKFDRIVSVEMFEHAKNYQRLFAKVASWLEDDGKTFVHIFSHMIHQYHFGEEKNDWLARYFFSGGTMPSDLLFSLFNDDLVVRKHWRVNGLNYQKTADAWLENMQKNRKELELIIAATYGKDQQTRWWVYWRLFFLACSELWGYRNGNEWIVSHYLFEKR